LFGSQDDKICLTPASTMNLEETMKNLQNQLNSFQPKVIEFETKAQNQNIGLNMLSENQIKPVKLFL